MISIATVKRSVKDIGIRGTAIRTFGYFMQNNEARLLRKYSDKHIKPYMESREIPVKKMQPDLNGNNIIWVCWFQGIENAPQLVKKCHNSLRQWNKNIDIRLITDENYVKYIGLPEHIKKKYNDGIIQKPHFSDIIRAAFLYCYGGIWVDSTMLFTASIPEFVWESDMFVFKFTPQESKYQVASSQFVRARENNEILRRTLVGLFYYWKTRNKLISYYLFHYVFASAVDSDVILREKFNRIPLMLSASNHVLQWRLFEPYSEIEWKLMKASFVHKLSYKHLEQTDQPGTFYKHIFDSSD